MRVSTALLCLALLFAALFAAAEAREVASRSERRAAERARAEQPKAAKAAPAAPAAAQRAADDDDDDDDDDDKPKAAAPAAAAATPAPPRPPVDPEDDEDDSDDDAANLANKPAAPVDPDARENWADLDVMTSLWRAVSSGDMSALEGMLRENALVARMRSADGRSGLFWAYEYEQPDMVQALLRAGARDDVRDRDGNAPKDLAPKASRGGVSGGNRAKATDFTTCDSCVNAGFGWDTAAAKCSATSTNKSCPDDDDDDDDKDEL